MMRQHGSCSGALAALAIAAMLLSTPARAAEALTEAQALGLRDHLLAAMVAEDWAATDRLLSEDLVYIHAIGMTMTKSEEMDLLVKGRFPKVLRIEAKASRVVLRGGAALVSGEVDYTDPPTAGGAPGVVTPYQISTVWTQEADGAWRMILWQATKAPGQK